jgi:peptidyl-prolyl cis-trans isomerase SurA
MGKRMRVSADQLTQMLKQSNVDAATLKSRIRSEIAWTQIVRGKFASSLQMSDKEVRDAMQQGLGKDTKEENKDLVQGSVDNKDDSGNAKGVEFTMRPILMMVPRGAPQSVIEERKREAEGLRARFANCDTDLASARTHYIIRDQVVRTSADLLPDLRKILEATPVGHLTPPDVTDQGVQVFAVCAKREIAGDTPEERQVREKLFAQKFEEQSKRYLAELRRGAMIEVK